MLGCLGLSWNKSTLCDSLGELLREHRLFLVGLSVFSLWLANRSLGPLLSIDAGLYHLTSIKWAAEAPLIGGLGNLHGRLAFNSSALLWLASLDQWPSQVRAFNIAPGLLLLAALVQIAHRTLAMRAARNDSLSDTNLSTAESRAPAFQRTAHTVFHATLLLPLAYAGAVMHVSSTSPDWIVLILGMILASELFESFSPEPGDDPNGRFLTIAALCAVGIKVKLSFAALGATALAVATFRVIRPHLTAPRNTARSLGPGIFLLLLLLVPWSLRSIELSGYPAYPSTLGAVDVSWRMPKERVDGEVRWIRSWARAPGKPPAEVLGNTRWIVPWLTNRLGSSDSVVFLLFPAALLVLGLFKSVVRWNRAFLFPATILIPYEVAVFVWFLSAPDPRFLGGSLWVCAAGLLAGNSSARTNRKRSRIAQRFADAASALCIVCIVGFFGLHRLHGYDRRRGIHPTGPRARRLPGAKRRDCAVQNPLGIAASSASKRGSLLGSATSLHPYPAPRLGLRVEHRPLGGFELK